MATVVILGSASAVADERREHTYLAVAGREGAVLIDCAGQALVRLRRAGLDPEKISDVVLTHFHPDHVYGLPVFMLEMWLSGRQRPLQVHGLAHCIERMERLMEDFDLRDWPAVYPVSFRTVEARAGARVVETADFRITASPVQHIIPTLGVRIEDKETGRVMAYTSDTHPCPEVIDLARGVDLLIHEATGAIAIHSTAAQAGTEAQQAGAKRLALIHYEAGSADPSRLVFEAGATFGGPVTLAEDFGELEF
jgi:ribonuclease Z